MKHIFSYFSISLLLYSFGVHAQALYSPDDFLKYKLGSRFTQHHRLVDYFHHVDDVSDKVKLIEFGSTYELRPMIAAIVSSPENIARIEEIRMNNLRRTGMEPGEASDEQISFVYLGYSVHGNEAAGSECSMAVLHDLAKGGEPYDTWLKNTVVILEPSMNPDGYNRFSQWSNSVSSNPANARPETRDHSEPWPNGRPNHYYFDLNRDWAWQSQKESRDRIAFYLQWMPHVVADLHEMFAESPYYFAPAAPPYHEFITPFQASFQVELGQNHATHFDREGWRYFTKEFFDLLYPSYGDTYPAFAGAVGMTYEQGGSGYSNLAVLLANGDTLTLSDRIAHHRTASLSTIETCSRNAAELVEEFATYFKTTSTQPPGPHQAYVIKGDNHPGRLQEFLILLDRQGIRYGIAGSEKRSFKGFDYVKGAEAELSIAPSDIIIPAAQPRAVITQVLLEPKTLLEDSLTYDITAWCIPMAHGLRGFASESSIDMDAWSSSITGNQFVSNTPYAYILQWGSVPTSRLVLQLMSQGISCRYANQSFRVGGKEYEAGTILIMRADNRRNPSFDQTVRKLAQEAKHPLSSVATGFVESGRDFGSAD